MRTRNYAPDYPRLVSEVSYQIQIDSGTSMEQAVFSAAIRAFARAAARNANVREIEPGHWYADAPGFNGAWGDGDSPEAALADFEDVVEGWAEIKLQRGSGIPSLYEPVYLPLHVA